MKKIVVLVVGLGNIGYRHLQSILKINCYLELYLIDKNLNNLLLIRNKIKKLDKKKKIKILSINKEIVRIKKTIDIVIISTNSDVRYGVLRKIIKNNIIKYIILEKFLFQSVRNYFSAVNLLKKIKTFVHCPLRNYPSFQYAKKISLKKKLLRMSVYQNNLGICCNSIHYLDLFSYLTNSNSFTLVKNNLQKRVYSSKRRNFIEFKGQLLINDKKKSYLSINDNINYSDNIIIILEYQNLIIQFEFLYKKKIILLKRKNKIIKKFVLPYTSESTKLYVNDILSRGKCDLPNFTSSSKQHIFLLKVFLKHYNIVKRKRINVCPIT
jgi:hypothetical protein